MRLRNLIRATTAALVVSTAMLVLPMSASAGQVGVYVRVGPPRPVVERRIVAPGPGYVWLPGYYSYSGSAYVWAPGRWALPPRPRAVWVAPHWQHQSRGWFFVQGRWR